MKTAVHFSIIPVLMLCCAVNAWEQMKFCKKHLGCTKAKGRIFFALYFIGVIATGVINEMVYIPFLIYALLCHLSFAVLIILLFDGELEKKILEVVILTGIKVLAGNFAASLLSVFALVFFHVWKKGMTVGIGIWGSYLIGSLSLAVVAAVIGFLSGSLSGIFRNKIKKWYIILAIPLVFIIIMVDVVNFGASSGVMVVSDANGVGYWNMYYNQLFSHIAIGILTALSMCAAGFYVFGMDRIYAEQRKKEQYRLQVESYKMLEEQYGQMERLRHDMKNHVIAMQGLLECKAWEKLKDYLNQMLETGELGAGEEVTGNKVVDALLYRKQKQAERAGIVWECDMRIPKVCNVDDFDLCVLLGNILDNAVEACERLEKNAYKFINIRSGMVKKCLLLEAKNSTSMESIRETDASKKEKPEEHGMGLTNIRETANKYNGAISIELENHVFTVSVLLPLESRNSSVSL